MAYVIQGRSFTVTTTPVYTAPFLMAGLNAAIAQLSFLTKETGTHTLSVTFELSNDGAGSSYAAGPSATGIGVVVGPPSVVVDSGGTTLLGTVWCRLKMVLSAGASAQVALDVNTYSR
jgi:hypothetical protein